MPIILKVNGCRFFFFSNEKGEPPHVHIEKSGKSAKVWLVPVMLQKSGGFKPHEINDLLKLTQKHKEDLLEAWNAYFK